MRLRFLGFLGTRSERDWRRFDIAAAVVAVAGLELQCWLASGVALHDRAVTAVAAVLFAAPVAVRRVVPGWALVFSSAVLLVQVPLGGQLLASGLPNEVLPVAVLLALAYGAGAWLETAASVVSLGASLSLVAAAAFVPGAGSVPTGIGGIGSSLFYSALMVVPGWFVGRIAQRQARLGVAFEQLADQAEADRQRLELAAVAQERVRISGELQDIISHSVSSMVVQAGGARLLLRRDAERARASIADIEHTGREALADLRRLLGMLRKDADPTSLSPQPGIAQVGGLVDLLGAEGVPCTLDIDGELAELTPGVDLVAYRAVEAALSAASRHGARAGHVAVSHPGARLDLSVTVTPGHEGIDVDELGEELRAITERIELYDGTLHLSHEEGITGDTVVVQVHLPLAVGALS